MNRRDKEFIQNGLSFVGESTRKIANRISQPGLTISHTTVNTWINGGSVDRARSAIIQEEIMRLLKSYEPAQRPKWMSVTAA